MDGPTPTQLRIGRRAFVLSEHPDRGGDPAAFAAGLARFDQALREARGPDTCGAQVAPPPAPRVVVLRPRRGARQRLHQIVGLVRRRPTSPRVH